MGALEEDAAPPAPTGTAVMASHAQTETVPGAGDLRSTHVYPGGQEGRVASKECPDLSTASPR